MKSDWFLLTGLHRQHCNKIKEAIRLHQWISGRILDSNQRDKVRNQITLIKTWTSTIPVQIQSWDFGEIKLGLLADCVEALKIREIRLVLVNRAP